MKFNVLPVIIFSMFVTAKGQNISVNTTGAANSTSSMFEVLGIGTAANASGLYVSQSAAVTNAIYGFRLYNTSTSGTGAISKYGMDIQSTGTWNGASSSNIALQLNATGGINNYALVVPSAGGSVGIGTTSPAYKLDVQGGSLNVGTLYGSYVMYGTQGSFDTRATNPWPETYQMGVTSEFKQNTSNGLSDGGSYNSVLSVRQWSAGVDWSGGGVHQLGFTQNGYLWHRYSQTTGAWGSWYKLLNSGSGWTTTGNTLTGTLPTSPNEWIGTINASDWIIKSSNSERMRILSGGNVGIATSNPGYKLEVSGDARVTTTLYFGTAGANLSGGNQGGSIELGPSNSAGGEIPFIDFHYGGGVAQDFNTRIINDANGRLNIIGTTRINSAYDLPIADGTANQVIKTNGAGTASWGTITGAPIRNTFASNTTTTFYSDSYIQFRWNATDGDIEFTPQAGHAGWWDMGQLFEYHPDDLQAQAPHSGVEDINAATAGTWYDLNTLFITSEFGGVGAIYITKENSNAYPIYKLELLQHGSYMTFLVTVVP